MGLYLGGAGAARSGFVVKEGEKKGESSRTRGQYSSAQLHLPRPPSTADPARAEQEDAGERKHPPFLRKPPPLGPREGFKFFSPPEEYLRGSKKRTSSNAKRAARANDDNAVVPGAAGRGQRKTYPTYFWVTLFQRNRPTRPPITPSISP